MHFEMSYSLRRYIVGILGEVYCERTGPTKKNRDIQRYTT